MQTGIERIAAERARHPSKGWTKEHDFKHANGELVDAALCYINGEPDERWPWDISWWKYGNQIRNLERAGALIAAEMDRIQAVENPGASESVSVSSD